MLDQDEIEGIRELPPSPIRSPGPNGAKDPFHDDFYPRRRATYLSTFLSVLRTTHKYSAYTFSAFSVIHFLNTGAAPLLSSTHNLTFANENLTAARALYHSSVLSESLLVFGALGTHVVSGLLIRMIRIGREYVWYRDHARIPKLSWNSLTGYLILPFVAGHVFANRYLPWKLDIDITSSSVGHFITRNPWLGWSFYLTFVSMSALHITNGIGQYLGLKKKTRYYANAAVAFTWLAGLTKVVAYGLESGLKGRQYDLINDTLSNTFKACSLA